MLFLGQDWYWACIRESLARCWKGVAQPLRRILTRTSYKEEKWKCRWNCMYGQTWSWRRGHWNWWGTNLKGNWNSVSHFNVRSSWNWKTWNVFCLALMLTMSVLVLEVVFLASEFAQISWAWKVCRRKWIQMATVISVYSLEVRDIPQKLNGG